MIGHKLRLASFQFYIHEDWSKLDEEKYSGKVVKQEGTQAGASGTAGDS
jgi:hypothetical protein